MTPTETNMDETKITPTIRSMRDRAAIALFSAIEAQAHGSKDAERLQYLADSFKILDGVTQTAADAPTIGTTLSPDDASHLAQLSAFFEGVRHTCGLEGTRTTKPPCTPERINETLEAVVDLGRKVREATLHGTLLFDLEVHINAAFSHATKQSSASVLSADVDAARAILPDEPDYSGLLQDLAARIATIRELAALASSAPKLRAELEAANAEVERIQGDMRKANDYVARCGSAPTELNAIRDALADAGFRGDNPVTLVATALESLANAQKERDANDKIVDAIADMFSPAPEDHDLVNAVRKYVDARHMLSLDLSRTQSALRLANTQLGVTSSNLDAALTLLQGSSTATLVLKLRDLVAFWRKGSEPLRDAASKLNAILYESGVDVIVGKQNTSQPIGVALNDVKKHEPVSVELNKLGARLLVTPTAHIPSIFDCGCSQYKVMAGMCDVYDEFGKQRPVKP